VHTQGINKAIKHWFKISFPAFKWEHFDLEKKNTACNSPNLVADRNGRLNRVVCFISYTNWLQSYTGNTNTITAACILYPKPG